ncbi:MAG: metallo-beta-lactamase family protein [Oleiphilaceae bacterium]|jgi:metallo-beta-lactamase family protein
MHIQHHGAVNGVTGSCHQLHINNHHSVLIDCGLFQGAETAGGASAEQLSIDFDISTVQALIVTHCHIDHVGRIPYLLAAGFTGPIYATEATAALLPLVIEDALKVGVTRNKTMIKACLALLTKQLVALPYKQWQTLALNVDFTAAAQAVTASKVAHESQATLYRQAKIKFQPAGHILGSAYVEIDLSTADSQAIDRSQVTAGSQVKSSRKSAAVKRHRVVFSGDLGAPYAPLLPAPKAPYRADTLVIESTYGDKLHPNRKLRSQTLKAVIEKAVSDNGVVLIPAFSIGRTQELLYEIEQFIYSESQQRGNNLWQNLEIIIDSPMAANFTRQYRNFKHLWDKEAQGKLNQGRHPLNFEQLYTIDSHKEHLSVVNYLASRNKPAIVIAASGMCSGGRIINYLERFLPDPKADVVFVGYQAQGTPGRDIQKYGPRGGHVYLPVNGDRQRIDINAGIHTISGYSAHADQAGLINFVKRMRHKPKQIRIVHGDDEAKAALAQEYRELLGSVEVVVPVG